MTNVLKHKILDKGCDYSHVVPEPHCLHPDGLIFPAFHSILHGASKLCKYVVSISTSLVLNNKLLDLLYT